MKFLLLILFPTAVCLAWAPHVVIIQRHHTMGSLLPLSSSSMETGLPDEMFPNDEDDPCWQNIYDDDCAMSKANLAFFRVSTWVKGMPCAEGIEDCDMPEALKVPEVRPHEHVDVSAFLNLKRAKHIGKDEEQDDISSQSQP